MSPAIQVVETRRGGNGVEVLVEDEHLNPHTIDYLCSKQVTAVFFDEEEFESGQVQHGTPHPVVGNNLKTLQTLRKVPILNWFVRGEHVQYEQVRVQVSKLIREGVAESGDGDSLDMLLSGLREAEDVVGSSDPTYISPRFIAFATIALRSRLGRLEPSHANQLVVAREYTRLCTRRCVRASVQECNRSLVMECFFKEDVLDRLTTRFSRLPRWLEWFIWWSRTDEPALQRYT